MLALAKRAEVAYTALVSVSVEPSDVQAALRAGIGARWPFLSDHDRTAQATLAGLWRDLREVTRTVRSDWDVPAP